MLNSVEHPFAFCNTKKLIFQYTEAKFSCQKKDVLTHKGVTVEDIRLRGRKSEG